MKKYSAYSVLGCALFGLIGCAGDADSSDPLDGTSDDLSASGIIGIEVNSSPGFVPVKPDACFRGKGLWKVDFQTKKLTGSACVSNKAVTLNAILDNDELAEIRSAIRSVRIGKKPAACPTDGPTDGLVVRRASGSRAYANEMACRETPVTSSTLSALVAVMNKIGAASKGRLDLTGVRRVDVALTQGMFAPEGECWGDAGNWSVNLDTKMLTGSGCYDTKWKTISTPLFNDELSQFFTKFAELKMAPKPDVCPQDVGVNRLTLQRGAKRETYEAAVGPCFTDAISVDGTSLYQFTKLVASFGK